MPAALLINARRYETRVALVEDGLCLEVQVERHRQGSVAGNVYLGRVARVLPGMQAAFVDIGLGKGAFLYVGDVLPGPNLPEDLAALSPEGQSKSGAGRIEDLLKEGMEIVVQVSKEPLGGKGARITSQITLPGRHLVYMPTIDHVGVSRRIEDETERSRLREMIEDLRKAPEGFIARTASEGQGAEKLKAEMSFLASVWEAICRKREVAPVPALLHQDLSVSLRAVRDLATREVDHLVIDDPAEYKQVEDFVSAHMPRLLPCVQLYDRPEPIFETYGVETDLARSLGPKVWLKSGGYIVIEKTEALTTIDVNTGRFVGWSNLEDTIVKTNLEAVKEIAYQLRLRDIGGLIVIDFIDMERSSNRKRVVTALKEALVRDRARTNVLDMSDLGLVEMTRKRVRESLAETLYEPCYYCEGKGTLKAATTVCYELFRALERECAESRAESVEVVVHPRVADVILQEERQALEELEGRFRVDIHVTADPKNHAEHFQIHLD